MSASHVRSLVIGTRGSKLALAQTELIRAALLGLDSDLRIDVQHITTRGDVVLDRPISAIGDRGLFVGEIEQALRDRRIDLAVHSAKDLPAELDPELTLAAFPRRADPRDVLVSRNGTRLSDLPPGARIGTSSLRRTCQLLHLRPDVEIVDLRGNVDTRLRKLDGGQYEAIVLAAAGLDRLGVAARGGQYLPPEEMVPAVGQGALAVQARAEDAPLRALLAALDDEDTRAAVLAERAFLRQAAGGCQTPLGAFATVQGHELQILGMLGARDGRMVRGEERGGRHEAEVLGAQLARALLERGGTALLGETRGG